MDLYTELMLKVPAAISSRVKSAESFIKEKWISDCEEKQRYYGSILHKVTGGFTQYLGKSKQRSKETVMECFMEYREALAKNRESLDWLCHFLFGLESTFSCHFWEYATYVNMMKHSSGCRIAEKDNSPSKFAFASNYFLLRGAAREC